MRASRSLSTSKKTAAKKAAFESETVLDFLKRELPPAKRGDASYLADAVLEARTRYDRYAANKERWLKFAPRRSRLEQIATLADNLAVTLGKLDILSRDDLEIRFGRKETEYLVGSLVRLNQDAVKLAKQVQSKGRPRNLAEERWILELARIYENAFDAKPRIWGSGSETGKRRGNFYDFLMVSRPSSFPQHGKLSPRQVHRTLEAQKSAFVNLKSAPI
jgi:hypothetical protein